MARYKALYTEEDFLKVLNGELRTIGGITKIIGCARMTCITYIDKLIKDGKIEKLSVDDGQMFVYRKV